MHYDFVHACMCSHPHTHINYEYMYQSKFAYMFTDTDRHDTETHLQSQTNRHKKPYKCTDPYADQQTGTQTKTHIQAQT